MEFNSAKIENSNKSFNNLTYLDLERFNNFTKPANVDYTMASNNFSIIKPPTFTNFKIVNNIKLTPYSEEPVNYIKNSDIKTSNTKEFKKIR
jgi:hypothetical protein